MADLSPGGQMADLSPGGQMADLSPGGQMKAAAGQVRSFLDRRRCRWLALPIVPALIGLSLPRRTRPDQRAGRAASSWARSTERAVTSDGPYQVRLRPSTSATRWRGNISGPSPALNA